MRCPLCNDLIEDKHLTLEENYGILGCKPCPRCLREVNETLDEFDDEEFSSEEQGYYNYNIYAPSLSERD